MNPNKNRLGFSTIIFINKVFGIVLLFVLLGKLHMTWRDIGFHREKLIKDCLKGFGLCAFFSTSAPVQSGSDLQTTSSITV